jgi:hypothetical protein
LTGNYTFIRSRGTRFSLVVEATNVTPLSTYGAILLVVVMSYLILLGKGKDGIEGSIKLTKRLQMAQRTQVSTQST